MSIGYRCVAKGFGFHWPPYSEHPYYDLPCGKRVYMYSEGYCPYLDSSGVNALPAASDENPRAAKPQKPVFRPARSGKEPAEPRERDQQEPVVDAGVEPGIDIRLKDRAVSIEHLMTF